MIPGLILPMLVVLEITNCVEVMNFSKQFIDKLALKVVDRIETRIKVTTFSFIFPFHQILTYSTHVIQFYKHKVAKFSGKNFFVSSVKVPHPAI